MAEPDANPVESGQPAGTVHTDQMAPAQASAPRARTASSAETVRDESGREQARYREDPAVAEPPAAAAALPAPDPSALGLPAFVMSAVALAIALIGWVPASAIGAPLPIIIAGGGIGLIITTIWAAAVGQSAVAAVFGIFGAFWISYSALIFGVLHNSLGLTITTVIPTQKLFLITWLVVFVMLTIATLRLPVAYSAVFGFVALAVLLILLGVYQASPNLQIAGGAALMAAAAVGVYLFFHSISVGTGGKPMNLGKPLQRI
jgi:succinate-acetate transporter protein